MLIEDSEFICDAAEYADAFAQFRDYNDEVIGIMIRAEGITAMSYDRDIVQTTPEESGLADAVAELISAERKRDYWKVEYWLKAMRFRNICRNSGFSETRIAAIMTYYEDEKTSYSDVAEKLGIDRQQARYLVRGGKGAQSVEEQYNSTYGRMADAICS